MATKGDVDLEDSPTEWLIKRNNPYNKLLPYGHLLDDEAHHLFHQIKTNLLACILAKEIRPGCTFWAAKLLKYVKLYGLKFSKEDHIGLINLFYNLISIPNLEPMRINIFANVIQVLLKKHWLIHKDDLQLDWRPLYDLCIRLLEKSKTKLDTLKPSAILEVSIKNLIYHSRIYFPVEATQDILDEFRPHMNPFDLGSLRSIAYFSQFLPVVVLPGQENIGYNLWFEELMNFWEISYNVVDYDNDMMVLMGKLAEKNCGRIDWEPYLPIMYVRFLRCLHLPVGYRQKQTGKKYKMDMDDIGCWIAYTLEAKSAFSHLEKFMQCLESYFHSANVGKWKPKIIKLLNRLVFFFVERIHDERYRNKSWLPTTPNEQKLTDEQIEKFVGILIPSLKHAMFSSMGNREVAEALQFLAALRPDLIVPLVLDKIYMSMNTLTEPHKLTASMTCLISVSRFMVSGARNNYPQGPTHVIPLLNTILPGIDPNDFRKCCATFNVIGVLITLAPLVDSSKASNYYTLTEEEHMICESSACLEDFVLQFFDRIFAWVEAQSLEFTRLEQTDNNFKSRMEILYERTLSTVISVVLYQCSPEIFTSALKKVKNFALNRILEFKVSGRMIAIVCSSFARVNPKETLHMILPELCDGIEDLLGSGEEVVNEEHLSDDLLYYMLLLSELVSARSELLPYMDRITRILDRTLHMTCDKGAQMAARTLDTIMATLTIVEPIEYSSSNIPLSTPLKDYFSVRDWAKEGSLNDLKMEWFVPNKQDIDCVQSLINRYLVPELELLNKYSCGETVLDKKQLKRSLRILLVILTCQSVLPPWDEEPLILIDTISEPFKWNLIAGGPHTAHMPDGSNVRKAIVDTLDKVQKKLLEIDEGDTKSITILVILYEVIMFYKVRGQEFERQFTQFVINKRNMEDRVHQKKNHLRQVLLERVMLHQVFRNQNRSLLFSETHKLILMNLFQLSVSHYSEVRIVAQNRLFATFVHFPSCPRLLIPQIKEILTMDTTLNHEKFKGCLHVLLGPKHYPIIARAEWIFINEIWPLVIHSQPSEKLSIITLVNVLQEAIARFFPRIFIEFEMNEKCLEIARQLANNTPNVDLTQFQQPILNATENEKRICQLRLANHKKTMTALMDACNSGNLHWRYYSFSLNLMKEMAHPEAKYTSDVVNLFFRCLIDDSLAVRKIALRVCFSIFQQNKPKFTKIIHKETPHFGTPGIRSDNQWLIYTDANIPKTEEEWETKRVYHEIGLGYYSWPKEIQTYKPYSAQDNFSKRITNMSEQERAIFEFFNNEKNLEMLIKYMSMEEKKGKDHFDIRRFLFFKNFFKIFEDHFLPQFIKHLTTLINDKQEHCQRCAMEILSGIISGAKHWSFKQTENLKLQIIPILEIGILNISVETALDWRNSITKSISNRDPNRYSWLFEFFIKEPVTHTSSFVDCSRLQMLKAAIREQTWRNHELYQRFYNYLITNLSPSFQNLRDVISSSLSLMLSVDFKLTGQQTTIGPKVSHFFELVMPKLNLLYADTLKEPEKTRHSHEICPEDKMENIRLFKTVAKCLMYSLTYANSGALAIHFEIFPLVCLLQNNDTDEEYGVICSSLLVLLSSTPLLKLNIPSALQAIDKVSICPFWSARAVLAEFIPVFVFYNYATLCSESDWVQEIQRVVLMLLEDEQPEVRIKAGEIISGFLHCQFVLDQENLLEYFKEKSRTKLKTKTDNQMSGTQANGNKAVIRRHAGVLGLCAYVSSHPYDVPDFLPEVFLELGKHLNDPQPIPATIRQTFGNFKRTHHDNWEIHKLNFTEDQLSLLNDLTVPPSYYA